MKRLALMLGICILLLSFTGVVSAASNGNVAALPEVEKITFIHYESSTPPPFILDQWDDSEDAYRLIAGGVKWPDTISYEVNPADSGLTESDEEILTALTSASEEWDSWVGAELFNVPTLTSETEVGKDGDNRVVWADLDEGVIAVCRLWYIPATKTIVEFDIEFNTDYVWAIDADSTKMDVQNIGTHELGHGVGLNDLKQPKAWCLTMYQYSWEGDTDKSTLGCGDSLGIQELYGSGPTWEE